MKYQDFDRYDFLKDEFFVNWVKRPSAESDRFWQMWLKRFPHRRAEVEAARELLGSWGYSPARVTEEEAHEVLENILHHISGKPLRQMPRKQQANFSWGYAAAAVLVLGLAVGLWWQAQMGATVQPEVPTEWAMMVRDNPPGVKSLLRMGDGTVIHLNANSRLIHPERFAPDKREVWLEGEAFFEVAHDPERPFTVHSGELATTVLGTSFNIRAGKPDDEKWAVSLVTGKVNIKEKSADNIVIKQMDLLPGEQFSYRPATRSSQKTDFDQALVLAWHHQTIAFEQADFQEIVQKLSDWYGVTFEIKGQPKHGSGFSGKFTHMTLDQVLKSISYASGFEYEIQDKTVFIYSTNH